MFNSLRIDRLRGNNGPIYGSSLSSTALLALYTERTQAINKTLTSRIDTDLVLLFFSYAHKGNVLSP